jgi:DNA-binding NarL/FixJ family response regulator
MPTPARVLIADGDRLAREHALGLLSREGYEVDEAIDAREARARLAKGQYALLIADINMTGYRELALLGEQGDVPVLAVTNHPTVETAVEALRSGAIDYLAKPPSPEQLLLRVADGVARGRALRTLRRTEARLRGQLDLVAILRESLPLTRLHPLRETRALPGAIAELLSPREREVLQAFRATPKTAEVATRLYISPHTVKNHMKAIFRKLEVGSQAELLVRLGEAERGP